MTRLLRSGDAETSRAKLQNHSGAQTAVRGRQQPSQYQISYNPQTGHFLALTEQQCCSSRVLLSQWVQQCCSSRVLLSQWVQQCCSSRVLLSQWQVAAQKLQFHSKPVFDADGSKARELLKLSEIIWLYFYWLATWTLHCNSVTSDTPFPSLLPKMSFAYLRNLYYCQ